jgi:hypothetical protein
MSLSPKDRVLAQIHHQETDYSPYTIGFEGDVAERLDAYYGDHVWRNLVDNAIREVPGPNLSVDGTAGPYYTDLYGSTWQVDCRPFHLVDIMPDLIEIGLDVLESVQPEAEGMDPYQLKRRYRAQITFWGGPGSQSTIPLGTPDEIRGEAARLSHEMGRGGGYILSPAKDLQPETPTENAAAVVEAFLQQAGVRFP